MKTRSIAAVAIILSLLALSSPAYCWDEYAHMVVDQIAYNHLSPKAKMTVRALVDELNKNPDVTSLPSDVQPYNCVTVGAWMDDMKAIERRYNAMHFVDMPWTPNATAADVRAYDAAPGAPPNAYRTIEQLCIPTLRNPRASSAERAAMLGFLMHLVGDVHQPLHAIGRQRGGNDYKIDAMPSFDPTWRITNLHAFWDNAYRYDTLGSDIVVVVPTLAQPRPTQLDSGPVHNLARTLTHQYEPGLRPQIGQSDPAEWVAEGTRIACSFAFPAQNIRTLTPAYVHHAHVVACERIVLAGCRLAHILNVVFNK